MLTVRTKGLATYISVGTPGCEKDSSTCGGRDMEGGLAGQGRSGLVETGPVEVVVDHLKQLAVVESDHSLGYDVSLQTNCPI